MLGLSLGRARAGEPRQILTFSGPERALFVGHLVTPGDINGDGLADLIVGAVVSTEGGPVRGRFFVYFGGIPFDTLPDVVVDAGGFPVGLASGPADLNGDGWPDLVTACEASWGEVRIYFGGPQFDSVPDVVIRSEGLGAARFGQSLEGTLDINGDGFQDLVIGFPSYTHRDEGDLVGSALIYLGGPLVDDARDVVLRDEAQPPTDPTHFFGEYVHAVGDFDGDGWGDLGVYQDDWRLDDRVLIYRGGPTFDGAPFATLRIASWVFYRNRAFAPAGGREGVRARNVVVQGDRYVKLGEVTHWEGGQLWLYRGADVGGPRLAPDTIFENQENLFGDLYGDEDVTGDGVPDLVLCHYELSRIRVFEAGEYGEPASFTLAGARGTRFGLDVAALDFNGDGVRDLAILEPGPFSPTGSGRGRIHVYDLSHPLPARAFVLGQHRTTPLVGESTRMDVRFEAVEGSFENEDVSLSSIRLVSVGTGGVVSIQAEEACSVREADTDHNGVHELQARFSGEDISRLFDALPGRQSAGVALEGRLLNGREFRGTFSVTTLGTGKVSRMAASASRSSMGRGSTLTLRLPTDGLVTLRLFDISGRLVRTLLSGDQMRAGVSHVTMDGQPLASGIYFYTIASGRENAKGKLVIAK